MGQAQAALAGNGFAAAIQSATNEVGKALDGTCKGLGDAVMNVAQDTLLAVFSAGPGNKLPKVGVDKVADKVAWKIALRFRFLGGTEPTRSPTAGSSDPVWRRASRR
ncbi:MAG: hypothetical protein ACK4L4_13255 [Gemmobacter sp.]